MKFYKIRVWKRIFRIFRVSFCIQFCLIIMIDYNHNNWLINVLIISVLISWQTFSRFLFLTSWLSFWLFFSTPFFRSFFFFESFFFRFSFFDFFFREKFSSLLAFPDLSRAEKSSYDNSENDRVLLSICSISYNHYQDLQFFDKNAVFENFFLTSLYAPDFYTKRCPENIWESLGRHDRLPTGFIELVSRLVQGVFGRWKHRLILNSHLLRPCCPSRQI